ncbi:MULTISPECIES: hypothetical protein [unclassified Imperialibacter]|uniref:hypothetical protein n=1 Tax=unclassified Imperialibacter TaxID=2629706 RepID=UPI0012510FCF|nr:MULTISPECIES: hypothetical protein [unclassified Imperialibacter]CAD5253576.1 conserved hypothetical protein [Imperialibacter sp. 89]CAD5275616.1 conserved hypothetical protein [Imperialibacter sp. 75]VVT19875.1 conserved hypothetical protein [Imperialibacter sp. EC-SDR9]
MKAETLKLGLIERVMQVQKKSTLERMDQLITQAEMETRTQESLEAISKGDTLSLDEFSQKNKEWAKENYRK